MHRFISGGIIASLIDCHSVCSAIATGYQLEGREVNSVPTIWYMTTALQINYLRPVAIDAPLILRAAIKERQGKKLVVACSVYSKTKECVRAEVTTRRVPSSRS